ncbi:MAG: DUF2934 domain-containing protein [Lacunisphaera sp.]|nr:DUF2934 domain-containing protein [Lacunisphaera sp.]
MNSPSHEEISRRAYQLWHEYGSPADRDLEIWLNAERQLTAKAAADAPAAPTPAEPAVDSVSEPHLAPALPDQAASQAFLQKQTARAPQIAHHTGPHAKPPVTGKPLHDRPHSS